MSPTTASKSQPMRAFTLIELMVVVAILALLISILLPNLARAQQQAYQVKCAANLKGLFKGMFFYAEDKHNGNGYLPQLSNQYYDDPWPGAWWPYQIKPYLKIKRSKAGSRQGLLRCPAHLNPTYRYIDADPTKPSFVGKIGTRADERGKDPVALKQKFDQLGSGSWMFHIEPLSYSGSCDSRAYNPAIRDDFPRRGVIVKQEGAAAGEVVSDLCRPVMPASMLMGCGSSNAHRSCCSRRTSSATGPSTPHRTRQHSGRT